MALILLFSGEYSLIGRVSNCGFDGYGFKSHYSPYIKDLLYKNA